MKDTSFASFHGSSFWELVFDFVACDPLCSRNSIRKARAINKSKFYFTSFLTGFTALLAEIKAFLTGHKHLVFFGLLNPCSYSSGHGHLGDSIGTGWGGGPLGKGC